MSTYVYLKKNEEELKRMLKGQVKYERLHMCKFDEYLNRNHQIKAKPAKQQDFEDLST